MAAKSGSAEVIGVVDRGLQPDEDGRGHGQFVRPPPAGGRRRPTVWRASTHASGDANDQASGIALRTRRGAKLAKTASTTPAPTAPNGAARKPK